jgi:hypothetical protein
MQRRITLVVLASIWLTFTVGFTSCEQKISSIKTSSSKIATAADQGVNITRELYESKVISPAQTKVIAQLFANLAAGGILFDSTVANIEAQYGSKVPASEIAKLSAIFNTEIVDQFLAILEQMKLISNSDQLKLVIESIRVAVLAIASVFGTRSAVNAHIQGAQWQIQ